MTKCLGINVTRNVTMVTLGDDIVWFKVRLQFFTTYRRKTLKYSWPVTHMYLETNVLEQMERHPVSLDRITQQDCQFSSRLI